MSELRQLCVFRVGPKELVLDIMRVQEILPALDTTQVPNAPAPIEGVANLRGAVVPVVDLRKVFDVAITPTPKERLLMCRVGRRLVGLRVDAVTQVVRVGLSQLRPAPMATERGYIIGVCTVGDRLLPMLDVKALLQ